MDKHDALVYYLLAVGAAWTAVLVSLIPNARLSTAYGIEVIDVATIICLLAGGAGGIFYIWLSSRLKSKLKRWLDELGWIPTGDIQEPGADFNFAADSQLGYRILLTHYRSKGFIGMASRILIEPAYKRKLDAMSHEQVEALFADLRAEIAAKGLLAFDTRPQRHDVPGEIYPVDRIPVDTASQADLMLRVRKIIDTISVINAFLASRLGDNRR
ncbi:MAG: hypothetical protein JRM82_01610 [Nitrososphaerota archaeon]|nr:hypothetical protein [Nitrososphaerota archaeon]